MEFQAERGIGYCGLACVLCSYEDCPGCVANINDREDDCTVRKCVSQADVDGCYACSEYPCGRNVSLLTNKRNRAFNRYAKEYGKEALIDRLRINCDNGIRYHESEKMSGDYDALETEEEIYHLLKFGRKDPYLKCPVYGSESFHLRLVRMEDAWDLFLCYSDAKAQEIFNVDRCNTDFCFSTVESLRAYIAGWLEAYNNKHFIRYSIVDKKIDKAIGTVEIFGGELGGERTERGVLRIDIRHEYENTEALDELLKISDKFFLDVNTEKFITKAIPQAKERIKALIQNGYTPTSLGDGENGEHYYMKKHSSVYPKF